MEVKLSGNTLGKIKCDENANNLKPEITLKKCSLMSRPVLGNLTNKLQDHKLSVSVNVYSETSLKKRSFLPENRANLINDLSISHSQKCLHITKSTNLNDATILQNKRARCDIQINSSDNQKDISDNVSNIDESEIDHTPFKSKLACDIVRAAFADRVQLEELLAECRRTDFAISALDRSPVDQMMEATDYIVGIMAYEQMREAKDDFQVSDFLASGKQPNLTTDMLTTLADWLVEVQENFTLNHETIHLAWGLLYAFLDRGPTLARREIQLMACAAVMVACKHEERQMPPLSEFLYITDNAYTKEEFIEAERRLLIAIDFAVHRPNPYVFLRRYARVLDAHSGPVQFTSRFLLEAGMHSHAISLKRESRKAAAVLWLSRVVLRNPAYLNWTKLSDVRQLRHFIRHCPVAHSYYNSCCQNQKQNTDRDPKFASGSISLNSSSTSLPPSIRSFSFGSHESAANELDDDYLMDRANSDSKYLLKSNSYTDTNSVDTDLFETLSPSIRADLEALHLEEQQRQPLWPPILEHITGYKEMDLIPLALRYHTIAFRLIAEVARGGRLALEAENTEDTENLPTDLSIRNKHVDLTNDDGINESTSNANLRCVSPGGHYLRRQSVSKYCSSAFLSVADAYPQLAFDNLIPHFPSIQCPETCACFVCINLIRRSSSIPISSDNNNGPK